MNKKQIDTFLPIAYQALTDTGVARENTDGLMTVSTAFRGYVSNFGAAITMGSFKAAVAFFSKASNNQGAKEDRTLLTKAVYAVLKNSGHDIGDDLLTWVCEGDERVKKELVLNAVIAVKLAMNRYNVEKDPKYKDEKKQDKTQSSEEV